jgi:hypothetical protein
MILFKTKAVKKVLVEAVVAPLTFASDLKPGLESERRRDG